MRSPTGRVQGTTRPLVVNDTLSVTGKFPMLICELRVESNRNVNDIIFWSKKLGLNLRLVQEIAEGTLEAYEVWGAPDALERFISFSFVQSYHLPVACRIGFTGQGSGESKPQHRGPLPHAVAAVKREDKRVAEACRAKKTGLDDTCRRQRLFGHE